MSLQIVNVIESNLYERLGERDGIRIVVDNFYDRLETDELLGPFFADADLERLRRTQTEFLCEVAGGPERYDAEPVREAHLHVPFEPKHIQQAIDHLEATLKDHGVPEEDAQAVVGAIAQYESDLLARSEE